VERAEEEEGNRGGRSKGEEEEGNRGGRSKGERASEKERKLARRSRRLSGTASVLDPDQYPGAAEQFAMPLSRTYEALLGAARGFLTAVGSIKAAFV